MPKPTVLLVHGMGSHTEASFLKEFTDVMEQVFALYPSLHQQSIEDFITIKVVAYNDIFDTYRQQQALQVSSLIQQLTQDALDGAEPSLSKVLKLQSQINDDEFFFTHWLDVILYRFTHYGTLVQQRIAKAVVDAVIQQQGHAERVHIMAHSLGTAATHDALSKLYSTSSSLDGIQPLDVVTHKLGSLHMIANTSRALESFVSVNNSPVKPDPNGCLRLYREYRHTLDPITRIKPFNPTGNSGWIYDYGWVKGYYALHLLTSVTHAQGNIHSMQHYLFNPKTHLPMLHDICGIVLNDDEKEQAKMRYLGMTLKAVAEQAEKAFIRISTKDIATITDFLKALQTLKSFIEKMGGQLDA
jgi:hypothetical protein